MTNPELKVNITADAVPFQRAVASAQSSAAQFAQRVQGPVRELTTSLAGVSGGFGAIAEQAASAIGLGAPWVLGIAAAVAGFVKLKQAVDAVSEAFDKVATANNNAFKRINDAREDALDPIAAATRQLREEQASLGAEEQQRRRDLEALDRSYNGRPSNVSFTELVAIRQRYGLYRWGGSGEQERAAMQRVRDEIQRLQFRSQIASEEIARLTREAEQKENKGSEKVEDPFADIRRLPRGVLTPDNTAGDAAARAISRGPTLGEGLAAAAAGTRPLPFVDMRSIEEGLNKTFDESKVLRFDELRKNLIESLSDAIGQSLAEGIGAGFEALFQTGSIGAGFAAMTAQLLSGLGRSVVAFGKQSLAVAINMKAIQKGLASFLPGGAITASLALIAIGSALGAVGGAAQRSFGGNASTAGGFAGSSASAATALENTGRVTVNIPRDLAVNPADPRWQDVMIETIRQASGRDVEVNYL